MIRPAIIDTNVVVAGLITARSESPVARILDSMVSAAFPFVVSPPLLAEYRSVLARPGLRRLHGLKIAEIETLLVEIARHAVVVNAPPAEVAAPAPGDQLLWGLLMARDELVLVTGDRRLLDHAPMRGRVLAPVAFVQGLAVG